MSLLSEENSIAPSSLISTELTGVGSSLCEALPSPPTAPILIIDDDPAIRNVLEIILQEEGFSVCVAQHGQEALELLRHLRPKLILLDLMMPVMDGWQFLYSLQTDRAFHDLAVVVLSASRNLASVANLPNVVGYLSKPFELSELVAHLDCYR